MNQIPVHWREVARAGEEYLNDGGYVCHERMIPLPESLTIALSVCVVFCGKHC